MKLTKPKAIRWTRDEYYKMAQANLFGKHRVELIKGEIIEMSPQDSLHATGIRLVDVALRRIFAKGFLISVQLPLSLNLDSDPEPDIAVVPGSPRDYVKHHPRTAILVVKVADTSLEYDRREKASLYAEAGIPEYWIVNLLDRSLEDHRDPCADPKKPFGFGYASVSTLAPSDSIAPLALPEAFLSVSDLLP